jgi:hypothetical protein
LGSLGLDPSHLSLVLSSDGNGKKVNVDITTLPLVEFVICNKIKRTRESMSKKKILNEQNEIEIFNIWHKMKQPFECEGA